MTRKPRGRMPRYLRVCSPNEGDTRRLGPGAKPLESILAASRSRGRWATLGVERYPDRKHIHIRCNKDTRNFSRLQMYSRILARGILVRVLVDVATFAVQVHVELLGSELHYCAIGKHDGDAYHRFSLLWLPTSRILPYTLMCRPTAPIPAASPGTTPRCALGLGRGCTPRPEA